MGIFAGDYDFESPPSPDAITARLGERCGLRAVIKPGRGRWARWSTLRLPQLGEGASLYRDGARWSIEYDQFPPSPFFLAHVDATFRELGGATKHPQGALQEIAAKRWQDFSLTQRLVFRSRLIRTVAFAWSTRRRKAGS